MQNTSKLNLQQIQQFLHSSEEIRFKGKGRAEIYTWVARTLRQHGYSRQNRADKGLLRQYLVKMTGLSRAQITRLIQQYRPRARSSTPAVGSSANTSGRGSRWPRSIACGGAEPTASGGCISPRPGPRRCRSASGKGQPGFLRVDTVHQGDRDGVKGVYHINAVDEVTQWQVVARDQ